MGRKSKSADVIAEYEFKFNNQSVKSSFGLDDKVLIVSDWRNVKISWSLCQQWDGNRKVLTQLFRHITETIFIRMWYSKKVDIIDRVLRLRRNMHCQNKSVLTAYFPVLD